jgi:ParB-like chromosome segregation protein Spo0J
VSTTEWPADKVERWSLDRLIPYATNARTHTPEQIDRIAASITEWGWTVPILADEHGGVIAGHARILAARKLGLSDAPVMVAIGWTQAQKRAYVLADNQLAINGTGWDESLLRVEMADLRDMAFDLSLIGFGEDEVEPTMPEERGSVEMVMRYQIIVDCDNERHQALMLEELQSHGAKCRPLIL